MRELKFRGFSNGEMEYSKTMHDFGFWKWVSYDSDTKVMQFTGLKDKNGVDIYEGDIIQFNFGKDCKEGIINTEVCFDNGIFCYNPYNSKQIEKGNKWVQPHDYCNSNWWQGNRYPLCKGFYGKGDLSEFDNSNSRISTIGNIYQNPELL